MRAAQLPDDINILQQLAAAGYLVGTPSQDYDDSYCIGYAKSHNAYIVTNDMYRYFIYLFIHKLWILFSFKVS